MTERFKKNIEKKRRVIQNRKNLEQLNLPTDSGMTFVDKNYEGPFTYGMAKIIFEREPDNEYDFPDCITIWWDGLGWRRVRKPYPVGGYVNINPSLKYWTPVQSKDDVPVPGSEMLSPKPAESARRWWQFSRKSKHTST